MSEVKEDELQAIYDWVDGIPLSRPKKSISRDFADGVLLAEVIHYELPRIIEIHNYSSQNGISHRQYNWDTLNHKVFKHHLAFSLTKEEILALCEAKPNCIEKVLKVVKAKLAEKRAADADKFVASRPFKSEKSMEKELEEETREQSLDDSSPSDGFAKLSVITPRSKSQSTEAAKEAIEKLQHTNELLKMKVEKLEQLMQLKDAKIAGLQEKLRTITT